MVLLLGRTTTSFDDGDDGHCGSDGDAGYSCGVRSHWGGKGSTLGLMFVDMLWSVNVLTEEGTLRNKSFFIANGCEASAWLAASSVTCRAQSNLMVANHWRRCRQCVQSPDFNSDADGAARSCTPFMAMLFPCLRSFPHPIAAWQVFLHLVRYDNQNHQLGHKSGANLCSDPYEAFAEST